MDNKSKQIGLVGLGVMGKPMAKNLLKGGFNLTVFDIKPEPVQEVVALGAKSAASPAELAAKCDIIITMLPNSPHVESVVCGPNGILEGVRPGSIYIDMSSISPAQLSDDKTVVVIGNTDTVYARQSEEYYAEPDWPALQRKYQEEWRRKAYPSLYEKEQEDQGEKPDNAGEDV